MGVRGGAAVEDRHDEARIHGIQDVGDPVLADEGCHFVRARGVHASRRHTRVRRAGDDCLRSADVAIRHHDVFEEGATEGRRDERAANTARADDEDSHGNEFLHEP